MSLVSYSACRIQWPSRFENLVLQRLLDYSAVSVHPDFNKWPCGFNSIFVTGIGIPFKILATLVKVSHIPESVQFLFSVLSHLQWWKSMANMWKECNVFPVTNNLWTLGVKLRASHKLLPIACVRVCFCHHMAYCCVVAWGSPLISVFDCEGRYCELLCFIYVSSSCHKMFEIYRAYSLWSHGPHFSVEINSLTYTYPKSHLLTTDVIDLVAWRLQWW